MQPPDVRDRPARRVSLRWLMVAILALACAAACGRSAPVVEPPHPAQISGTVRGPQGTSNADSRVIEVVNVETGEKHQVTTNTAGAFSCKLKPGKYRVDLTLRTGESLVRGPGIIDLNRLDVDTNADFVLGTVRISRPRGPAYRTDDGLGSPIA